jgi:hypothetical protein
VVSIIERQASDAPSSDPSKTVGCLQASLSVCQSAV